MRKKQIRALEKLEKAEKMFKNLQLKLQNREEIKEKSGIGTLALCAKYYSTKSKDLQYSACVIMYKMFGISKTRYPALADRLKSMLRSIANKFFTKKQSSQLKFNF